MPESGNEKQKTTAKNPLKRSDTVGKGLLNTNSNEPIQITKINKPVYKCQICSKEFTYKKRYDTHFNSHLESDQHT